MRAHLVLTLALTILLSTACGPATTGEAAGAGKILRRSLEGFTLLDPAPEGSVKMPNGTLHFTDGQPYGTDLYAAADGRIFTITITRKIDTGEEISDVRAASERTFGMNFTETGNVRSWEDGPTRANLIITRGYYRISISDTALIKQALGDGEEMPEEGK